MKDVNANTRILVMSAVLNNLDKFPNIDFGSEFAPILIKELTSGSIDPGSWCLNNFSAIINFLVTKKLVKEDYAEILKCFFEVSHFNNN